MYFEVMRGATDGLRCCAPPPARLTPFYINPCRFKTLKRIGQRPASCALCIDICMRMALHYAQAYCWKQGRAFRAQERDGSVLLWTHVWGFAARTLGVATPSTSTSLPFLLEGVFTVCQGVEAAMLGLTT